MTERSVVDNQTAPSAWRDFLSVVGVLVSALILAYVLINFVFQSYQVDGPSMESTLENGDHLIILKVPRTMAKVTGNDYIPKRGDIIVFKGAPDGQAEQMIKRVIALPGERVVVEDGAAMVYNKEHPRGFSPDETLPYGSVIVITPGEVDVAVKAGEVFVMGDNRENSVDSREIGPVKANDIVGKLVLRAMPLDSFKRF